jgi:hypothetical protein
MRKTVPRATSPPWRWKRGVTGAGPVQMPSPLSRPRSVTAERVACGRPAGIQARPLAPRPPPGAQRSRRSHASAAERLPSRRASRPRAPRTPPTARPSTDRPGADLAAHPRGRRPPGPAERPMHRGRNDGSRSRDPSPLRAPPDRCGTLWASPRGLLPGRAAPPGRQPHARAHPCPPSPQRRGRGRPLSRPGQAPSPTAPGAGGHAPPGPPWAGAEPPGPTLSAADRPRQAPPPGGCRPGTGPAGVYVGHGPGGRTGARDRDPGKPGLRAPPVAPVSRQRRSPGVVQSASALGGGQKPSGLERGRPPRDPRQVAPQPRRAVGSTVVSSWLRRCRWTTGTGMQKLQPREHNRSPPLDIGRHSNATPQPRRAADAVCGQLQTLVR